MIYAWLPGCHFPTSIPAHEIFSSMLTQGELNTVFNSFLEAKRHLIYEKYFMIILLF